MGDLAMSVLVGRSSLNLAALELENPGTYQIIRGSLGPGNAQWRRETAQSPYVHGEVLVGAVRDIQEASLGVRVEGGTAQQLAERMTTVIAALTQFSFPLTVTLSGVVSVWDCQVADYSIGQAGVIQDFHWRVLQQEITFTLPRQPIPLMGGPI